MRAAAEIEMIENPKTRASRARLFNRRNIERLAKAEIARGHVRRALMLDAEDDDAE